MKSINTNTLKPRTKERDGVKVLFSPFFYSPSILFCSTFLLYFYIIYLTLWFRTEYFSVSNALARSNLFHDFWLIEMFFLPDCLDLSLINKISIFLYNSNFTTFPSCFEELFGFIQKYGKIKDLF